MSPTQAAMKSFDQLKTFSCDPRDDMTKLSSGKEPALWNAVMR